MLAQSRDFFNAECISFEKKLEIAKLTVLSQLNYGQDIITLNATQTQQLESLLGKTLRAILGQPRKSKTAALQLIANQQNIETQFASRRLQNHFRIKA